MIISVDVKLPVAFRSNQSVHRQGKVSPPKEKTRDDPLFQPQSQDHWVSRFEFNDELTFPSNLESEEEIAANGRKMENSKRLFRTARRAEPSRLQQTIGLHCRGLNVRLRDVYYPIHNASIANLSVIAAAEASVPQVRCWLIPAPPLPCQACDEGNVTAAASPDGF